MPPPKAKMSSSTPDIDTDIPALFKPGRHTAAVITVSDSCSRGEKEDLSGPAVVQTLELHSFRIVHTSVIADDKSTIQSKLIELCATSRLVITTGGTGIAPRDVTPEATIAVCDRLVEGIAEQMRLAGRSKTRFSALSRAVCGVRGTSLIVNLPGSPSGAVESLDAVIEILPHALELIAGHTQHKH